MQFSKKAAKAIVAAAVPLIASLVLWWATGSYDAEEVMSLAVAFINAVLVYAVPNKQSSQGDV